MALFHGVSERNEAREKRFHARPLPMRIPPIPIAGLMEGSTITAPPTPQALSPLRSQGTREQMQVPRTAIRVGVRGGGAVCGRAAASVPEAVEGAEGSRLPAAEDPLPSDDSLTRPAPPIGKALVGEGSNFFATNDKLQCVNRSTDGGQCDFDVKAVTTTRGGCVSPLPSPAESFRTVPSSPALLSTTNSSFLVDIHWHCCKFSSLS